MKKLEECLSKVAVLDTRTTVAEGRISECEEVYWSWEQVGGSFGKRLTTWKTGRWLVSLLEGSEGSNPASFFRTWLPHLLHLNFKGGTVKLDRCHNALARRPLPGQQLCAVIIRLYNFQDKVQIMQAARRAQALAHDSAQIMIFEDFSAAIIRKRQEFYLSFHLSQPVEPPTSASWRLMFWLGHLLTFHIFFGMV